MSESGPTQPAIEAVQAAVVATINTLGVSLLGSQFTLITSSPIPDDEVAQILADCSNGTGG